MPNKIFVSYKYSDALVSPLPDIDMTTARHYVDIIATLITDEDHIYKGEDDGQSMKDLEDATIGSKLGDKIFDSSITIVLISKGMKTATADKDQWIPWEISYSLKEQSRSGGNSKTNAMLAVVLPDEGNSYDYYFTYNPGCGSVTHKTSTLFDILKNNMFNHKKKDDNTRECNGKKIYEGEPSYIPVVRWDYFKGNVQNSIVRVLNIKKNINDYNITKII